MSYYSRSELNEMGFKYLGVGVRISKKASIYNVETIALGDYSRIDDFCVISGLVEIGRYVHITPMCLIAGGVEGVEIKDFCALAYGVKVFSQSDDYSGLSMVNSLIPAEYKKEKKAKVIIHRHCIIGAGSTVMPGVVVNEGCAVGAMSLITRDTCSWGILVGVPAKKIKVREKNILELERSFLKDEY